MTPRNTLILFFTLCLSFPVFSNENFDKGVLAGKAKDYKTAVMWYRKAADQGFVNAQNRLGDMYGVGQG